MAVITLTSDYGLVDYRVAAIKGAIASLNESVRVIDITHDIQAYDLKQAAYIVRDAYKYFPKGSVHIISVDSFYRKEVKSLVYKVDGHYFISADNGILSLVFPDINPEGIYEITFNNRFDDVVNLLSVDVFAPIAVHLCSGGLPEVIGRSFSNPKELKLPIPTYKTQEKMIIGEVIYIDNFGNVVTNISKDLFMRTKAGFSDFKIKFRTLSLSKIYNYYTEFITNWKEEQDGVGKAVAVFNNRELLEITIYKGMKTNGAQSLLGLSVGERVYIEYC